MRRARSCAERPVAAGRLPVNERWTCAPPTTPISAIASNANHRRPAIGNAATLAAITAARAVNVSQRRIYLFLNFATRFSL